MLVDDDSIISNDEKERERKEEIDDKVKSEEIKNIMTKRYCNYKRL